MFCTSVFCQWIWPFFTCIFYRTAEVRKLAVSYDTIVFKKGGKNFEKQLYHVRLEKYIICYKCKIHLCNRGERHENIWSRTGCIQKLYSRMLFPKTFFTRILPILKRIALLKAGNLPTYGEYCAKLTKSLLRPLNNHILQYFWREDLSSIIRLHVCFPKGAAFLYRNIEPWFVLKKMAWYNIGKCLLFRNTKKDVGHHIRLQHLLPVVH